MRAKLELVASATNNAGQRVMRFRWNNGLRAETDQATGSTRYWRRNGVELRNLESRTVKHMRACMEEYRRTARL
jgi:hypothetical protein